MRFAGLMLLFATVASSAQSDTPQPSAFLAQLTEMTHRSGHSPTTDEIQTAEMLPGIGDPAVAKAAVPLLNKALKDSDPAMRRYALATLVGMQSASDAPPPEAATASKPVVIIPAASGPAAYRPDVARQLQPLISLIAKLLTAEELDNRTLAATVLGGFSAEPPAAVFAPLTAYLKRDDAVGAVGLEVVGALLQLGPVSDDTAASIARYLKRPDQTGADKVELAEAIAAKPNQSVTINKALLSYLDSDDASLRARVILSLPLLDLPQDTFADLKARLQTIVSGEQEALPVVTAAKAVVNCWLTVKMVTGCPAY